MPLERKQTGRVPTPALMQKGASRRRGGAFDGVGGSSLSAGSLAKRLALNVFGAERTPELLMAAYFLAFFISLAASIAVRAAPTAEAAACDAEDYKGQLAELGVLPDPSATGLAARPPGLGHSPLLLNMAVSALATGLACAKLLAIISKLALYDETRRSAEQLAHVGHAAPAGAEDEDEAAGGADEGAGTAAAAKAETRSRSSSNNQLEADPAPLRFFLRGAPQRRAAVLVLVASFGVFLMQGITYATIVFDFSNRWCWTGAGPSAGLHRVVFPLRLAYWAFSNPLIIIVCGHTVGLPNWQLVVASIVTCLVCLFGLGLELVPVLSPEWVVLLVLSLTCSTVILLMARRVLVNAARLSRGFGVFNRALLITFGVSLFVIWNAFPAVFLAAQLGGLTEHQEELALPFLDGTAKVLLCELTASVAGIYAAADDRLQAQMLRLADREATLARARGAQAATLAALAGELMLPLRANSQKAETASAAVREAALHLRAGAAAASPAALTAAVAAVEATVRSSAAIARVVDDFVTQQRIVSAGGDGAAAATGGGGRGLDIARLALGMFDIMPLLTDDICSISGPLGSVARVNGVNLSVVVGRSVTPCIFGDVERVRFVCSVLLQQSLRQCPRGGRIEVRISSLGWRPVHVALIGDVSVKKKQQPPRQPPLLQQQQPQQRVAPMPFVRIAFVDDGQGIRQIDADSLFDDEGAAGAAGSGSGARVAPAPPVADPGSRNAGASSALVLSRATAEMLGGAVGVETERGVGTMLFFDLPAFASEEDLLTAAYGGRVTATQRRLLGLAPHADAGSDGESVAESEVEVPSPVRAGRVTAPAAAAALTATPAPTLPQKLTQAQLTRGASVAALAIKRAAEPAPVPASKEALEAAAAQNTVLLQQYTSLMGERGKIKPVDESRRSSTASSIPEDQKAILTRVLVHTNIR